MFDELKEAKYFFWFIKHAINNRFQGSYNAKYFKGTLMLILKFPYTRLCLYKNNTLKISEKVG